jgi:hypothetical protein
MKSQFRFAVRQVLLRAQQYHNPSLVGRDYQRVISTCVRHKTHGSSFDIVEFSLFLGYLHEEYHSFANLHFRLSFVA